MHGFLNINSSVPTDMALHDGLMQGFFAFTTQIPNQSTTPGVSVPGPFIRNQQLESMPSWQVDQFQRSTIAADAAGQQFQR